MNNIEIRQLPKFTTSIEIMKKKFLESLKPEERLAGLKPEERLAGLKPKDLKKLREIRKILILSEIRYDRIK